jgi:hypothetical protein
MVRDSPLSRRRVLAAGAASSAAGCARQQSGSKTAGSASPTTGPPAAAPGAQQRVTERVAPDGSIGDALAALPESGGRIVLEAGDHSVDSPIRRDIDSVTIVGAGTHNTVVRRNHEGPVVDLVGEEEGDRRRFWSFRGLTLDANGIGAAPVFRARFSDVLFFERVRFRASNTPASNLVATQCWDWKFDRCQFAAGGNDADSGDVVLVNGPEQCNNFHFSDCRWERMRGVGVLSDTSGSGGVNHTHKFTSCKFHGTPDPTLRPDAAHIDGAFGRLQVTNCSFAWSNGFLNLTRGDDSLPRSMSRGNVVRGCRFLAEYREPAIRVATPSSVLAHNYVRGRDQTPPMAIHVDAADVSVTDNVVEQHGVRVQGDRCRVANNTLVHPREAGIVVNGRDASLSGNAVQGAAGHGLQVGATTGLAAIGNVIRTANGDAIRLNGTTGVTLLGNRTRAGQWGITGSDVNAVTALGNVDLGSGEGAVDLPEAAETTGNVST